MQTDFTPFISLGGGLLIGLAAVLLMAVHGRILGATGILSGLLRTQFTNDWKIRAALLTGMVIAPTLVMLATGSYPTVQVPISKAAIIIGGVIVGIGVSFGGGCTSGHGVCGNARFSRRSLVATATFMAGAFVTVFVIRHIIGA